MKLRIITLAALLACSVSASAVDITISVTPGELADIRTELGKSKNYLTPETPAVIVNGVVVTPAIPGVPRIASAAEVKTYLGDALRILTLEGQTASRRAAKLAEVVPPTPIDPK